MSVSLWIIWGVILLVMFGVGQRILDDLRLSDKAALLILVAISIGLLIPPIWIGEYFCFSIGGFLIPLALSIYLLISCGGRDLFRALIGTILVAGIIYGLEWILPADPEEVVMDNMYIYGIVAGIVAYVLGRSRRNAFVSCLFGITLAELIQWIINFATGNKSILGLGVGGAFSTYIVAIILSVALSEFLGRCFETASLEREEKVFNYKTHTYDSEKNGKLNKIQNTKSDRIVNLKNANNSKNNQKSNKNRSNKQKINSVESGVWDFLKYYLVFVLLVFV